MLLLARLPHTRERQFAESSLLPTRAPSLLTLRWLPDPADRAQYMSMAGDDGWCKHYDKDSRRCTIYESRPQFCRVDANQWEQTLGVPPDEVGREVREACRSWIGEVYGEHAEEMLRFDETVVALGAPSPSEDALASEAAEDQEDEQVAEARAAAQQKGGGYFETEYMEYMDDGVEVAQSCGRPKAAAVPPAVLEHLPPTPPGVRRFKNRRLPRDSKHDSKPDSKPPHEDGPVPSCRRRLESAREGWLDSLWWRISCFSDEFRDAVDIPAMPNLMPWGLQKWEELEEPQKNKPQASASKAPASASKAHQAAADLGATAAKSRSPSHSSLASLEGLAAGVAGGLGVSLGSAALLFCVVRRRARGGRGAPCECRSQSGKQSSTSHGALESL